MIHEYSHLMKTYIIIHLDPSINFLTHNTCGFYDRSSNSTQGHRSPPLLCHAVISFFMKPIQSFIALLEVVSTVSRLHPYTYSSTFIQNRNRNSS